MKIFLPALVVLAACSLPSAVASHYQRGCDAYDRGDFGEAVREFDLAIEEDEADYKAWFNRGVALQDQERPAEAETSYRRVLEIQPENARACVNLASLMRDTGRDAEALDLLQRAGKADPASAFPWTALGSYWESKDDTARAKDLYAEGLRREPTDPAANCAMGNLLLRLGQPAEALNFFEVAIDVRDDDVPSIVGAGRAQAQLGNRLPAVQNLQKAVILGRRDKQLLLEIADLLILEDDPWEALSYLAEARRAGAPDADLLPRLQRINSRLLAPR